MAQTIEADRLKIEKVIAELDVKKNQALQTTWVKVSLAAPASHTHHTHSTPA